jgi:hypothetical protein
MDAHTADFSLDVQGVKGFCPAGELYAKDQIAKKTIPVLSCEGPCIRGEIAAANLVLRSPNPKCHVERLILALAMAHGPGADKSLMIDGCSEMPWAGAQEARRGRQGRPVDLPSTKIHRRLSDGRCQRAKTVARQVADRSSRS